MKLLNVFLVFTIAFLAVSCSNKPDDSTTKFVKGNETWKQVPTGKLNKFGNVETTTIYYQPEFAVINPTWGQAFYFAGKGGYWNYAWVAYVLLLGLAALILLAGQDIVILGNAKTSGTNLNIVSFVVAVIAAAIIYIQPSNVKFRNQKTIDKAVYEKALTEKGNSQPIWDSLLNNRLIIGGPVK